MKAVKRIAIWLVSMIVIVLLVNIGGSFIVKKMAADTLLGAYMGYSKKAERLIHPITNVESEKDQKTLSASLILRSLFSEHHLVNEPGFVYNFAFSNFTIDESHIIFDKDGLNELSSGIFVYAYKSDDEKSEKNYLKKAFGLIDINDFCKQSYASEIYNVLESEHDVVIRLNSYTISDRIIKPVSITLLDKNGNELLNVECPYEGELIEETDCYILNDYSKEYEQGGLYAKMSNAFFGERKSNRIANKLINEVNFDKGDYNTLKMKYGLGNMSARYIEVTDGYAMITVLQINFIRGVVFYTVILGGIMSLIMLIVSKIKSR